MATPHGFLSALIGWLRATPEDRVTRRKIRARIAELVVLEYKLRRPPLQFTGTHQGILPGSK